MNCYTCGVDLSNVGHGLDSATGRAYCYQCCANRDIERMRSDGRAMLYLTTDNGRYVLTNWPGTLKINVLRSSVGKHNIARKRYDVWFDYDGAPWHGVTYGDNTQICHCKRIGSN